MSSNWEQQGDFLIKTFRFSDFLSAMAWMSKAAPAIEALGHHPEWTNVYNRVTVKLTTHDAGNKVTEKDHALAKVLDGIPLK